MTGKIVCFLENLKDFEERELLLTHFMFGGSLVLGVGDMAKIFYHGICNFISRLRYISRFIIRRVTRFGFLKKRTLQRWRNVSTDIYLLTLKNTKVQKQYCLNRLLA